MYIYQKSKFKEATAGQQKSTIASPNGLCQLIFELATGTNANCDLHVLSVELLQGETTQ